ncbi:N-acetylglucosamine-6-phosphate deacetylase [Rummeliibacillus stabekisii]|uniref:N-acetylglucosamine-6-phosphate deacetylase n=1 Tax=Rummeliibacillus stabekisii TaxID=241244 RepID=A0A143HAW4_9BACL|nr:N-acetylglucosamine-6-phosphate deacetylase [Rummeliibacillus stabekisii]
MLNLKQTCLIKNVTIVNADERMDNYDVYIKDGVIQHIGRLIEIEADEVIDGVNQYLLPGFIDMHIHGSAGSDAMDATPESLHIMAKSLLKEGTTSFLATTMTQSIDKIEEALKNLAVFKSGKDEAEMVGVHLEGPFVSKKRAGAQPLEHIIPPQLSLFQRFQELSGYRIKEVTVAPETDGGFEFVENVAKTGVVVSIGHSDATFEEVQKAVVLGVKQGTHLYNQMRPFHHRDPGVVGGTLLLPEIQAEIIVDFIHSHQESVKLAYQMKGADHIILITDAMRAKGLPYGDYDLGGQLVHVTESGAHLENGALAGSVLKMDQALRNMKETTNCTLQELVAMTSFNAAKQLNLTGKGRIKEHYDADLVLLDKDLKIQKTIKKGNVIKNL